MALGACGGSGSQGAALAPVARQDLSLSFGDYQSHAQLTYPATGGRHAAVVLVPGSYAEDLNADVCSPSGRPLSHIFADIADYLSPRGYAVLRYDKHYVTGSCQGSTDASLGQLLHDAGTVLQAAESDPHVDPRRIFVYGWSEGSTVAAALVLQHPEVAGLVVQGPVVYPWQQVFAYQDLDVGVAYLRSLAPDGKVTAQVLRRAAAGDGGLVAKSILRYVATPGSGPGHYAVNPALDTNHDGVLDIGTEVVPGLQRELGSLLSPAGPLHDYGPGQALPVLGDQASKLTLPTLILQGENDGNVAPSGATELDNTLAASQKSVIFYPGLGHSLGPAASPVRDDFAPIAHPPLANLTSWLDRHQS